jgi:hypothetical protein
MKGRESMKYLLVVFLFKNDVMEKHYSLHTSYEELSGILAEWRKQNIYAYQIYELNLLHFYGGL